MGLGERGAGRSCRGGREGEGDGARGRKGAGGKIQVQEGK